MPHPAGLPQKAETYLLFCWRPSLFSPCSTDLYVPRAYATSVDHQDNVTGMFHESARGAPVQLSLLVDVGQRREPPWRSGWPLSEV